MSELKRILADLLFLGSLVQPFDLTVVPRIFRHRTPNAVLAYASNLCFRRRSWRWILVHVHPESSEHTWLKILRTRVDCASFEAITTFILKVAIERYV